MNFLKVGLAVLVGCLLGAMLFHTPVVKASPAGVHVYIVPVEMSDAKTSLPKDLPGGRVAGISCISKPAAGLPDAAVCYVATTP